MSVAAAQISLPTRGRYRRIEHELRALHAMQDQVHFWDTIRKALAILLLSLVCLAAIHSSQWFSPPFPLALLGALASGSLIWWIARHYLGFAVTIVFVLLFIVLDVGWFCIPGKEPKKPDRRAKLAQAISKREALLRSVDRAKP